MVFKRERPTKGDRIRDFSTNAEWLRGLEDRLYKLEQISGIAPVEVLHNQFGLAIGLIDDLGGDSADSIVQLQDDLFPYCSALANIQQHAKVGASSSTSTTTSSGCDFDLTPTTDAPITVHEAHGKTTLAPPNRMGLGIAKKVGDIFIFLPWSLAEGDDLPFYDSTQQQLIGHSADGFMRWYNVTECTTTGASSSGA